MKRNLLIVSPHLDDGVLSAAMTILAFRRQGWAVVVGTVFTAAPHGEVSKVAIHFNSLAGDVRAGVARRRREDAEALTQLGAAAVHLGLFDASFRREASGNWLLTEAGDAVVPCADVEDELIQTIARRLRVLAGATRADLILGPLGAGSHMDHLVVRKAIEHLPPERRARVVFYEDLPYAALPEIAGSSRASGLVPILVRGSAADHQEKLRAIDRYASQIPFFPVAESGTWEDVLKNYASALGAPYSERLWQEASSPCLRAQ